MRKCPGCFKSIGPCFTVMTNGGYWWALEETTQLVLCCDLSLKHWESVFQDQLEANIVFESEQACIESVEAFNQRLIN